ncbi:UvrD/REP helicase [Legionella lansingensis]|uniref:DNA 3'-5' helicase n=1 Tax=Legionella lansingensis TaxID=45067 RepID=A0A0W0VIN5_9GAMM|nr:UvrD-helicase domain-containing protein [Legionella lansingensis]KTD19967.1 UvrD/REP helicase [Legionella lansingensis]SNV48605.1 UvrD/REP helicase [Legionella lansingensis]
MLQDSKQREQATDPRRSFIVQAPAGSGKTELLTQRYLRLLATVNVPEEIVALTFTRKAASEMRERILLALKRAADGYTPTSSHQQQTHDYAIQALARCEQLGWQLLIQPARLRIMTIDALCQAINQAIPLQDKQIPYAQVTEKPESHYQAAARSCFEYALTDANFHQPLKILLGHLDNRQDNLLDLLSDLLAKRDQWLASLYIARDQSQATFEQMLSIIEQHELTRFKNTVPFAWRTELCALARQMAEIEANPQSPRYVLRDWLNFDALNRLQAIGLASLLLTAEDELRKKFDHWVGLKRGICEDKLYDKLKSESSELLTKLNEQPDFLAALLKIKDLPLPHYDPEQWATLQALFSLLPLLVGHLHLRFNEYNEVDFTAVSQQALFALGEEDEPTDLALYFDSRINHLLIDEFQDTSISQFHLLTKLVCGWQPDDGRTLFVVGDPMQSIYRFRQAEVGLFLKAKQQGIGPVRLTSLELCCNFRSTATIVDWINQQFHSIFPKLDNIESGAISFHTSVNVLPACENSCVEAYQFSNRLAEAEAVAKLAAHELKKYPQDQIAILVRSRTQLTEITRTLRAQQIPFQGMEIDLLSKLPHLRDLWSLTQALLLPGNRLAWLALLRSPFCGLSLSELHAIANFNKKKSILYALDHLEKLPLTDESRMRLQFVHTILHNALARRHYQSLVDWVCETFRELHGEKILDAVQQADLEQFWLLLERFANKGQYPNLEELNSEFSQLYSKRTNPSRLQVMTIHKSKGLEFDCVILPGLSAKSQTADNPLLRWLKFPSSENDLLLVSPIKASHREHCLLYNYLAKIDAEKSHYELQRLLYVAITRTKKRLYLFDYTERETVGSFRRLLNQEFSSAADKSENEAAKETLPPLYKLPNHFYSQQETLSTVINKTTLIPFLNHARQIGVVAHELLQWICDYHPQNDQALPWSMVTNHLRMLGFAQDELDETLKLLKNQIATLFRDPKGQWLIQAHTEEANEYALLVTEQGEVKTRVVDRTFIYNGQRWIIDFKTGSDEEDAQDAHRKQVHEYAYLFASNSNLPIRCGLYYLATGKWLEWDYSQEATTRFESSPI